MKKSLIGLIAFVAGAASFSAGAAYRGDFNKDNKVDLADMASLATAINSGSADVKVYDVNGSGTVDDKDLHVLADIILSEKLTEDTGLNVGIGGWDDSDEDFGGIVGAPRYPANSNDARFYLGKPTFDPNVSGKYIEFGISSTPSLLCGVLLNIEIPEGVEINPDKYVELTGSADLLDDHVLYGTPVVREGEQLSKRARFIIFSPQLKPMKADNGILGRLYYTAKDNSSEAEAIFTKCQTIAAGSSAVNHVTEHSSDPIAWSKILCERIEITPSGSTTLYPSENLQLTAKIYPEGVTDKTLTWTSSDDSVATVDAEGKVTAVAVGTAVITATAKDGSGVSASSTITVKPVLVTSITLDTTSFDLVIGKSRKLTATVAPENATDKVLAWTSSDTKVATVDAEGNVTAVAVGTAVITATAKDGSGVSASSTVTVKPVLVTSITLDATSFDLVIGKSRKLTATVAPENATDKALAWTSSDTKVATVDAEGNVTAVALGTAVITATAKDGSGVSASSTVTVKPVLVTSITLDATAFGMYVGKTRKLTATVGPENATDKSLKWTSSNPDVATVDAEGNVTAIATGTAVITATAKDNSGISASATVTVSTEIIKVTSIKIDPAEFSITIGESKKLTSTVAPENASDRSLTWTSSDPKVAIVDAEGKVTAMAVGTAVITATAKDGSGVSASSTVTVKPVLVTSITLDATSFGMYVGKTRKLTATVGPENATDKSLAWTSSNPKVATVDAEGNVTAIAEGTAVITATAKDNSGISASATVTVSTEIIKVTSIKIEPAEFSITIGESKKLTATVAPENAYDRSLTWTSSNPKVATVDAEGNVTAVAVGTAVITATAKDGSGVSASSTITVKPVLVTSITLDTTSFDLVIGKSRKLTATVAPENATDKALAWTSSDTKVATVDAEGNVTAVAVGTAVITATAKDGSGVSASSTVTVKPVLVTSITLDATAFGMYVGKTRKLTATVGPENATDKSLKWTSFNPDVATVDAEGNVTAIATGTAVITATAKDNSGISASATVTVSTEIIKVTFIKIDPAEFSITIGESKKLTSTVAPENASDRSLTWTSSDPKVAIVDAEGKVTAMAVGTAVIIATAKDGSGVSASSTVTVKPILVTSITLDATSFGMYVGKTRKLTATVGPENATDKSLAWTSSNPKVATVDAEGNVTAIAAGTAVITATAKDNSGISASATVTVSTEIIKVTSIKIDPAEFSITIGESKKLTSTVAPENASDRSLTWTSSNPKVATVDAEGNVTAVAVGTAVITATAKDGSGVSASSTVTVKPVLVTSITLDATSFGMYVGKTRKLTATVGPKNATDKSLNWSSSNPNVATVDAEGNVTALAEGRTVITATANDRSGVSASATVDVIKEIVRATSLILNNTELTLTVGDEIQLIASIEPEYVSSKKLDWSSDEPEIASVDQTGLVKVIAVGNTTIRVRTTDGSGLEATCSIIAKTSGVEELLTDEVTVNVYTLKGIPVLKNGTKDDLKSLESGYYIIVTGSKVIKTKI